MNIKIKYTAIALLFFELFACNYRANNSEALQKRIDSLEQKVANIYKPGFGEFMSGIQAHHAKLWFAGQAQNWKLADFEMHEIMEAIAAIQQYDTGRVESRKISMINPALDSVNNAVKLKDPALFKSSYMLLTNTCNNCHHAVNFEFNVVKIPDNQSFSNQDFKVH